MRVRTDFFVGALLRRIESAGAFATVAKRGAAEAGALFVVVDRRDGRFDLYGPAPQSVFGEGDRLDRKFSALLEGGAAPDIKVRIDQEARFDPDLWVIDIEDRDGRPFVDLVPPDTSSRGFTSR